MRITNNTVAAIAKKYGTPLYIYDAAMIVQKCRELKKAVPSVGWYYACKANTNAEVMKLIAREGYGIETVSPGEIAAARAAKVPVSKITFTCSSIDEAELVAVVKQGIRVHLDSLRQVEIVGKHFPGSKVSVRLNQGIGAGHHSHVITGGPDSKFGIDVRQIAELSRLGKKYRLRVTGLHQHIGSNILDGAMVMKAMNALFETAMLFPELEHLDFGGGLGVPYRPDEKKLDVIALGKKIARSSEIFFKNYARRVAMSFEPGRYLVAEAGVLAVKVNDVKRNPTKTFVGVNSGFNHLIRPAMYGSYHEIVNATRPRGVREKVTIAGNICESGDVFAKDRMIASPKIGDILIIKNAGAYGYTMSSDYNLRPKPREVVIK
jgi:diaminopimelate decarboxylase